MTTANTPDAFPAFTLGWRLRLAMEKAGLESGQLAAELNIDRATLTRWTHDKYRRPINPLFLRAIAERCHVDFDWLQTGKQPPFVADEEAGAPSTRRYLAEAS